MIRRASAINACDVDMTLSLSLGVCSERMTQIASVVVTFRFTRISLHYGQLFSPTIILTYIKKIT